MGVNGVVGEEEGLPDLALGEPVREIAQHFQLPLGELGLFPCAAVARRQRAGDVLQVESNDSRISARVDQLTRFVDAGASLGCSLQDAADRGNGEQCLGEEKWLTVSAEAHEPAAQIPTSFSWLPSSQDRAKCHVREARGELVLRTVGLDHRNRVSGPSFGKVVLPIL
jgi:hypothetical protein